MSIEVIPVTGIGEIRPGDDLATIIAHATAGTTSTGGTSTGTTSTGGTSTGGTSTGGTTGTGGTSTSTTGTGGTTGTTGTGGTGGPGPASHTALRDGDVVVVTQKVVSKAEDRLVRLDPDDPAARAALIESESVRVLRRRGDLVIVETTHGFVCANAGVDLSNIDDGWAALLPVDSDRSARRIRDGLRARLGVEAAVIVSDTFGRTWRRGVTDIAIGSAGIGPILDLRGTTDDRGRELQATEVAVVDEIAGAADLVMGKATGVPVAIVRGVDPTWLRRGDVRTEIVRPPEEDLFR